MKGTFTFGVGGQRPARLSLFTDISHVANLIWFWDEFLLIDLLVGLSDDVVWTYFNSFTSGNRIEFINGFLEN